MSLNTPKSTWFYCAFALGLGNWGAAQPRFSDEQAISVVKSGVAIMDAYAGSNKDFAQEPFVIAAARATIALGEFGESPDSITFLTSIEKHPPLVSTQLPEWLTFLDEYKSSIERIGRVRHFGDQILTGESDEEGTFGTKLGRNFAQLVTLSKEKLVARLKAKSGKSSETSRGSATTKSESRPLPGKKISPTTPTTSSRTKKTKP